MTILDRIPHAITHRIPSTPRPQWRDALAGLVSPRAIAAEPATTGRFQVKITGFNVNAETFDDALQRDGKRDEVFYDFVTRVVDAQGETIVEAHDRSPVMGDVRRQEGRIQAGTASRKGGLRTGDVFFREALLFSGELEAGKHGLVIVPSIWEFDPTPSVLQAWINAIAEAAPAIADVGSAVAGATGRPDVGAIFDAAGDALPAVVAAFNTIVGTRASRPIGMEKDGAAFVFRPSAIVLNFEEAEFIATRNFGRGQGIVPIDFRDDPSLRGDYTLFVSVQKLAPPSDGPIL